MGYTVTLPDIPPQRIVSLVPSQTELLFDLGLDKEVKGITKFCVHPPSWRKDKIIVGGTKTLLFDRIEALQPDLIIGNKEENSKDEIHTLRGKFPVWMSDIITLSDALEMIRAIGALTGRQEKSETIVNQISTAFQGLIKRKPKKVLYLIWRKPWMAAGPQTFIDTLLNKTGWVNCVVTPRYPELTNDDIRRMAPEIILLSSEPYPFGEKHVKEIRSLCPDSRIHRVDGEIFSWYGSRLRMAPAYFNALPQ